MLKVLVLAALVPAAAAGGGALAWQLGRPAPAGAAAPAPPAEPDHVAYPREFVVPVVSGGRVGAHVVLTLGLHSADLPREELLRREPIVRDRLLEALLRHAAAGAFDGSFAGAEAMARLRLTLNEAATAALVPARATVLVTSIDRRER